MTRRARSSTDAIPQMLTRHEVAKRLAVSTATVDRLIVTHALQAVRLKGRLVRVREDELARFLAAREV
jgi:excisionase family DNA binding protein